MLAVARAITLSFAILILSSRLALGEAASELIDHQAKDQVSFDSYPEKVPKPTHAQGSVPPTDSSNSSSSEAAFDAARDPSGSYPPEVVPYDPSYSSDPASTGQTPPQGQDASGLIPPGM